MQELTPLERNRLYYAGEEVDRLPHGLLGIETGCSLYGIGPREALHSPEKAMEVDAYILKLSELFGLPVEKTDERLSSYQAEHDFFSMGGKAGKSVAARQRHRRSGDIDSRAAALFLQEYLDCGGREVL